MEARTALNEEQKFVAVFTAPGKFEDVDLGADVIDTVSRLKGIK